MTVLVVGAGSPIGSMVVTRLREDHKVVESKRNNSDFNLDLATSYNTLKLPSNIDTVINFAASYGGKLAQEIIEAELVNSVGAASLLSASIEAGVSHFIHISSISALLPDDSPFHNSYALTKRHGEEMIQEICSKHEIDTTVLRPSRLYGVEEGFRSKQPFLYHIIDSVSQGEHLTVNGSHNPQRNFLHGRDLTEVIARVVDNRTTGSYNVTSPSNTSIHEIATITKDLCGNSVEISFNHELPDIADDIYEFDNSIYDLLNYRPLVSLETGIKEIISKKA